MLAPGKHVVEVHDYHDVQTGVLASSLRKRAPGYRRLGFPDPSTTQHLPPGRMGLSRCGRPYLMPGWTHHGNEPECSSQVGRGRSETLSASCWAGDLEATSSSVRFGFYGRTSTADYQDPASSQAWQRDIATSVIAGRGEVVVDFFDVGWSRRWRGSGVRSQRRCWQRCRIRNDCSMRWSWGSSSGRSPRASSCRWQRRRLMASRYSCRRSKGRWISPIRCIARWSRCWGRGRARGGAGAASNLGGDAGADCGAGPVPRWASAVRLSARGCRSASEPCGGCVGEAAASADPDPVTAAHVRWMFARRLPGRSLAGIARELTIAACRARRKTIRAEP